MASTVTNTTIPAKRLKQTTIEVLEEEHAEPIKIGTLVLPAGIESACGIMLNILQYSAYTYLTFGIYTHTISTIIVLKKKKMN